MACSLYNNNGFGCGGCEHFVRTISVEKEGDTIVLKIPQKRYGNKERVCICVAQAIPETKNIKKVVVAIGGGENKFPLLTKCGNIVYADQLRSRRVYHTSVATDTKTFVVSPCELCKTSFNFPTIS